MEFKDNQGAQKVLREGIWSVNKCSMVIREWEENLKLEQIETDTIDFWVQFLGLRLAHLNDTNAKMVGASLGHVVECRGGRTLGKVFLEFEWQLRWMSIW